MNIQKELALQMTVTQIKQALAQYREKMTDLDDGICYFDTKSFEGLVRLYASNFSVNETIESLKKAWGLQ